LYKAFSDGQAKIKEGDDKSKKVFVVRGRNRKSRDALFEFLHSIKLEPFEFAEVVPETRKGTLYIGEVLQKAFSLAQVIIVLMTPDDEARLREHFREPDEKHYEKELTPQARPNILFEAGMAFGINPDRTILIELGKLRPFSDITGRHLVKLDDTIEKRQDLANRLNSLGCPVSLEEKNWHTAGKFKESLHEPHIMKKETQHAYFPINLTIRESFVQTPIISHMAIEVRPTKVIADCEVLYNGERLLCDDNRKYTKFIHEGGTGLYRIPAGNEDENAEIVVLDGKKELLKTRLKDIHG
jgi:predicted nucleotide-binding protein